MESLNISAFLHRKRLKQRELAEFLGVSLGFIGQLAIGKSKVSYDVLLKLIGLGISSEELFGVDCSNKLIKNNYDAQINTDSFKIMKLKNEIVANNLFYLAKRGFEKQELEAKDLEKYFSMFVKHYSILVSIKKELDDIDFVRLNDLSEFIDKCEKKYLEGNSDAENFLKYFHAFVIYCYEKKDIEKKYFEKAAEVENNLYNKIKRKARSLDENVKRYKRIEEERKEREKYNLASENPEYLEYQNFL